MENKQFTYEKFATDGVFTLFDPLYTTIVVFSVLILFALVKFNVPAKIMLFIGAFTIIITLQLSMIEGILVDELTLNGSSKTTILMVLAIILQLSAIIFAFIRNKKQKASS